MKNWIKYAKFEDRNNYVNSARRIYERAVEFFGDDNVDEKLLISFAKFEEQQKEVRIHILDNIRLLLFVLVTFYNFIINFLLHLVSFILHFID